MRIYYVMLLLVAMILCGAGCGDPALNEAIPLPEGITFELISKFGEMAQYAYKEDKDIQEKFGDKYRVEILPLPKYEGKCLLLFDDQAKIQYIVSRGTNNFKNMVEDGKYIKVKDKKTGIYMHKGFQESAAETYDAVLPLLQKDRKIRITGHSLGGAEAAILHLYLITDGYPVEGTITFGQPRFTNRDGEQKFENLPLSSESMETFGQPDFTDKDGEKKFQGLPLLRVVDEKDLVPLVPPTTLISYFDHGPYRHLGYEILLLDKEYYCLLDEREASNPSVTNLWADLTKGEAIVKDHYMEYYMGNLKGKLDKSTSVAYNDREKYLDRTKSE